MERTSERKKRNPPRCLPGFEEVNLPVQTVYRVKDDGIQIFRGKLSIENITTRCFSHGKPVGESAQLTHMFVRGVPHHSTAGRLAIQVQIEAKRRRDKLGIKVGIKMLSAPNNHRSSRVSATVIE